MRPSKHPRVPARLVPTEDLLVGDERGNILYYVVEWPPARQMEEDGWPGVVSMMARISVHSQQICALVWSPDGQNFMSGSNDNSACYFEAGRMLTQRPRASSTSSNATSLPSRRFNGRSFDTQIDPSRHGGRQHDWLPRTLESLLRSTTFAVEEMVEMTTQVTSACMVQPFEGDIMRFLPGSEKNRWKHGAAVKAVAFCPWQKNLVATGGGSNDKCIHFWHVATGAPLATIAVSSQVTALIWSKTRPEIVATFGYATPDHPYRIAVFSWPSCRQVDAVAWENGPRVLYAIPYPGSPPDVARGSRTSQEGVIVMATSDKNVKFHEVWKDRPNKATTGVGILGGSDILEGLDGIDKDLGVIR